MTIAVCLLLVIGIFFVYSACFIREGLEVQAFYKRQIVWAIVGIMCYLFFAVKDYRILKRLAVWAYMVSLILLVLVLLIGQSRYGATRWLALFGSSGPLIQPSEMAKLTTLLFLARVYSHPSVDAASLKTFVMSWMIVLVPFILIVQQPDLGTALVLIPLAFLMMIVGGAPLKYIGLLVGAGVVGVLLVLSVVVLPEKLNIDSEKQDQLLHMVGLKEHQKRRIMVFLNLDKDPLGSGWNKRQSQIAVGSGGMWGKGFNKGTQNILGFLPRSVAPTDFIYSVIAEEKGFLGSIVVLSLFGMIITSGMNIGMVARDKFGRLLSVGVVAMIFSHVFVNMAMTIGLMPITGLPLPLLSYGGTFMVVTMSALGVVQSVRIWSRRTMIFEDV